MIDVYSIVVFVHSICKLNTIMYLADVMQQCYTRIIDIARGGGHFFNSCDLLFPGSDAWSLNASYHATTP
jgi:hypothetical protein